MFDRFPHPTLFIVFILFKIEILPSWRYFFTSNASLSIKAGRQPQLVKQTNKLEQQKSYSCLLKPTEQIFFP